MQLYDFKLRNENFPLTSFPISLTFLVVLVLTADWEARKQSLESKMPSQTKKEAGMESRQPETHTPYNRPQVTAAQVENYPMTKISQSEDHRRPSQQMDSSLSASPTVTTPQRNIINNVHEVGRGHVLPEDRNLVNSGEFHPPLPLRFSYILSSHVRHDDKIFGSIRMYLR
jgi:hypothetical protein